MTPDADLLLEGPRGRRLCLELAMDLDPDIRLMVFRLGYYLDSGRGTSRVLLTADSADDAGTPPAAPSPGVLAAALRHLAAADLDDAPVQSALERAVDTARYWQEPDGEDVLAGLPLVRAALLPLARRVIAAPGARWWNEGRGVEQWAIDWRPADDPAPLKVPQSTLVEWVMRVREAEVRAAHDLPADPHAPVSGGWWSVPPDPVRTVGRIPAGLSLVEDSLGWEVATTIPVRGVGRTLEIRTPGDWTNLCQRFPLDVTASRRHDWFRTTGRDGRWVIPDWERVADEWDAVHLTVLGYLSGAGRALPVSPGTATVIAGWDPDSTIWLTDVAREWEGPRQSWHRVSRDRSWRRLH
ncbi:hypothetical protein [Pseudarthrobacter sulfonivorans]|uniref:hypothetical protein n=1 Tax=Pseudarthrobacter sulfonivorans TaxID=121292 RepID=UPI00210819E5|nr:hypothetical protein [Pseudarthrobacter sulfonivorans]